MQGSGIDDAGAAFEIVGSLMGVTGEHIIVVAALHGPDQPPGIVAMRDRDDTIPEQVSIYQKRRDVLCEGLARMGWQVEKPKAGMFVWVGIPEPYAAMGSVRFAIEMMNRAHVAVAPGAGFGEEGDGFLRLALVENENRIRQALKQMKRALVEIDQEIRAGIFDLAGEVAEPDQAEGPDQAGS